MLERGKHFAAARAGAVSRAGARDGVGGTALLATVLLGGALLGGAAGCESPSSRVDGADLQGVFDRDAGPPASASKVSTAGSTRPPPSSSASASSSALSAPPRPATPRPPEGEGCVEVAGQPRTELARTLGRPACRGAEVLEWRDPAGSPRYACLFSGPSGGGPLPLVVFFHGDGPSLDAPTAVHKQTGLRSLQGKVSLGGPGGTAGFHVLAVQGRHFAGEATASFDAGHSGEDNVDRRTVDHFVGTLVDRKIVDTRRIYAMGLGPGGQMAATWAMLAADRVAAFAVFGAPPPTARWACPGPPPPGAVLYRACDAVVACEGVEAWLGQREAARAETLAVRLGDDAREELLCETRNKCGVKRGTAAHARWPKALEKRMLTFLAGHSLAADVPGSRPAPR